MEGIFVFDDIVYKMVISKQPVHSLHLTKENAMRSRTIFRCIDTASFLFLVMILQMNEAWWGINTNSKILLAVSVFLVLIICALLWRGRHQLHQEDIVAKLKGNDRYARVGYSLWPDWMLYLFGHWQYVWKDEVVEVRPLRRFDVRVPLEVQAPPDGHLKILVRASAHTSLRKDAIVKYFSRSVEEIEQAFATAIRDALILWVSSAVTVETLLQCSMDEETFRNSLGTAISEYIEALGLKNFDLRLESTASWASLSPSMRIQVGEAVIKD